ncbi:NUDIX domain-containing protein [Candidatus Nomurabacteria bacterium]|nr:NUDIX domain-containing protein [Candidatus Nomurabacteria bacterium]
MLTKKFASLLILEKEGQILLLRRKNTGEEDGNYTVPSGKVEEGETFTEAAIRETFEEVNAKVLANDISSVHIIQRKQGDECIIANFFLSYNWNGEIKNAEPHKCDDVQWFDIKNLPDNMVPFVKHALEQIYFTKKTYSELGW